MAGLLKRIRWGRVLGVLVLPLLLVVLALSGRAAWRSEQYFHYPKPAAVLPEDFGSAREVTLRTDDGVELRGWYVPSRNRAAWVLAHGLSQTRMDLLPEARVLRDAGYGVLLFDLRAHGQSGGETSTWGDKERQDVRAALAYVRAQPDVDSARVGALGFSIGSAAVAEVAAKDPQVAAVVLLSPFNTLRLAAAYDFRRFGVVTQSGALVPFWRRGIALEEVRTIDAVDRIKPRPLFIVAGTEESGQPLLDELFTHVAPYAQTWRIPGASHGNFTATAPREYPRRLLEFADTALKPVEGEAPAVEKPVEKKAPAKKPSQRKKKAGAR
ncbi:alpha/beta hydrolase [Corallococcus aberystwythensis]|uniref:Alpha/beta fold hydrolase n=1 Tax=Corallococcus aberystwythensis TaxID=2316722 RepID=A0A3A8QE83_9BACT|nr:alpha/beta fold hydrolase [Corallococcus aberystwythensis]RKH61544.1 alpha/beta fold hydrolase [Corallococcus aberystwythensis]